jgi:serine/threonine protein kinase
MAPELFIPDSKYTKSVDIWSFGVLLYYMIFGFEFSFFIFYLFILLLENIQ